MQGRTWGSACACLACLLPLPRGDVCIFTIAVLLMLAIESDTLYPPSPDTLRTMEAKRLVHAGRVAAGL